MIANTVRLRRVRWTLLLLACCAVASWQGEASAQGAAQRAASRDLVIRGATIVDVRTGTLLPGRTITVRGDSIVAITTGMARSRAGSEVVDATGKFLVPGLWDMHVHHMNTGVSALPLYLAHGVTGVREMGGYLDSTRAWEARMRAGTLSGPRLVTVGPVVESPQYLERVRQRDAGLGGRLAPRILPYRIGVGDSLTAERTVDSLRRLGVDYVKVRNIGSPAAFHALVQASRRAGLWVVGHLPDGIDVVQASDAGQRSIEHFFMPALASQPAAIRDSVYAHVGRNGTWLTPTLVVGAAGFVAPATLRAFFDDSTVRRDPMRPYYSASLLEWWRLQIDERLAAPEDARRRQALEDAHRAGLANLRGMRAAGAPVLAGTDAGSLLVPPGPSLHEELRLLVTDAGFTPRDALWAATGEPARFLGREGRMGTVAVGAVADLVLLDGNPLQDIRNTNRITAVVARGRLYRRAGIDSLLVEARRLAREPVSAAPAPGAARRGRRAPT
jgi:imidazolonepropionase-like amidohydrolase